MLATSDSSGSGASQRSYSKMARELANTRTQMLSSFAASTRLLDDIDLPGDVEQKSLEANQRSTSKLVRQLTSDQLDLHSDLKDIMASYTSGQLSADQLEAMIQGEQERSGVLMRMAQTMKQQLEAIFESYADMADKVECGQSLDSNSLSDLFLEFNEAINTSRFIGDLVSTPTSSLRKALPVIHSHVEQIVSSIGENRRKMSTRISVAPKPHQLTLLPGSELSTRAGTPAADMNDDGDGDDAGGDVASVVSAISLSRVTVRQESGSQTEHSGPVTEGGAVSFAASTAGTSAGSPHGASGRATAPSQLETAASNMVETGSVSDSSVRSELRVDGFKAKRVDRKEREKIMAQLAEKEQALQAKEGELARLSLALEVKAADLQHLSSSLALRETAVEGHGKQIGEEVFRRVSDAVSRQQARQGGGLDESGFVTGLDDAFGSIDLLQAGQGGVLSAESVTTRSLIESGIEAALAAQALTLAEELGLGGGGRAGGRGGGGDGGGAGLQQQFDEQAGLFIKGDRQRLSSREAPRPHAGGGLGRDDGSPHNRAGAGSGTDSPLGFKSGYASQPMNPDLGDDISSVGGASAHSHEEFGDQRGDRGRAVASPSRPPDAGVDYTGSALLNNISSGAFNAPPPDPKMLQFPLSGGGTSKNELIVIFPATKEDQATDMAGFKDHLHDFMHTSGDRVSMQPLAVTSSRSLTSKTRAKKISVAVLPKTASPSPDVAAGGMTDEGADPERPPSSIAGRGPRVGSAAIRLEDGDEPGPGAADLTSPSPAGSIAASSKASSRVGTGAADDASSVAPSTLLSVRIAKLPPGSKRGAAASSAAAATAAPAAAGLPIVSHNPLGLTTRTYKPMPVLDVPKELLQADNPLLSLLELFGQFLPETHLGLLADAAAGAGMGRSLASVQRLFEPMTQPLLRVDAISLAVLKELSSAEHLSTSLIVLLDSTEVPLEAFRRSLSQLLHQMGDAHALKMWIDSQLVSYRAIFDRINALRLHVLSDLSRDCPAFKECLDSFLSCQSRSVEIQNRSDALKEKCARYRLADPETWRRLGSSTGMGLGLYGGGVGGPGSQSDSGLSLAEAIDLEETVRRLEQELQEAREEAEDMNVEVFRVMQETDRTPGALLFFAALHDPVVVSVLQQLVLQLTLLKGFSDGSAHVDFPEVRKRLQVCLSCVPSVDRLVQRYSGLHKKWTQNRLGVFTNRGLSGGSSDATNLCPLCNNDPAVFSPKPSATSGLAAVVQKVKPGESQRPEDALTRRRNKKLERISSKIQSVAEQQQQRAAAAAAARTGTAMTDTSFSPRGGVPISRSLPALGVAGVGGAR